jgi:hypothetical protein
MDSKKVMGNRREEKISGYLKGRPFWGQRNEPQIMTERLDRGDETIISLFAECGQRDEMILREVFHTVIDDYRSTYDF